MKSSSRAPVADTSTNDPSVNDTAAVLDALSVIAETPVEAGGSISPVLPLLPQAGSNVAIPDVPETEEGDLIMPFKSEHPIARVRSRTPLRKIPLAAVGVCASVVVAGWIAWQMGTATPAASAPLSSVADTGTADFHSVPEGSTVAIDGTIRGVTPLRVSLAAGTHSVTLKSGAISRTLPITVAPGGTVSQYVELATAQATVGGGLEIGSDPPGAQVAIDGVSRGRTPLAIADVAPGHYQITVSAGGNAVNRIVNVRSGTTSTLVVSTAPVAANAAAGWLNIESPVDMDILEDGRVLGSTRMDRLMLPVGAHRIELANAGLEFTAARTVQIAAGRTANVVITLPSGRLSVNAVPWADVSLNGVSLGTTPLGDLAVPIGAHELVFRHPQLGERRQTVTVKAKTVARIGIDLRK